MGAAIIPGLEHIIIFNLYYFTGHWPYKHVHVRYSSTLLAAYLFTVTDSLRFGLFNKSKIAALIYVFWKVHSKLELKQA